MHKFTNGPTEFIQRNNSKPNLCFDNDDNFDNSSVFYLFWWLNFTRNSTLSTRAFLHCSMCFTGYSLRAASYIQVSICRGANVENCLIMNDTVIGENATLKNVILDKDVVVRPGATLIGTASSPIIVKKGEIV